MHYQRTLHSEPEILTCSMAHKNTTASSILPSANPRHLRRIVSRTLAFLPDLQSQPVRRRDIAEEFDLPHYVRERAGQHAHDLLVLALPLRVQGIQGRERYGCKHPTNEGGVGVGSI